MPIYEVEMSDGKTLRVGAPSEKEAREHAEKASAKAGEVPPRAEDAQKVKD